MREIIALVQRYNIGLSRLARLPSSCMRSAQRKVQLGIRDNFAHERDHIACFWETDKEFEEGVGFLEEGLRGKDHCVVFGYKQANQKVLHILGRKKWNVKALIKQGRLSVLGAEETGDATLASIGKTFQNAIDRGALFIRLLGNIGWGKPRWPKEDDIMRFEAKVTGAATQFPCVVVCMYDVNSLPGRVVLRGALETHPVTIRGNVLRVNPHFVPVGKFLAQLRSFRTRGTA
jgi:hypothetical protein